MVRTVAQIEQELAVLDQTVAALAQTFHDTYQQYLSALGQATRQQLLIAGYHICTHGYPEQFLQLSLSQRQDLQQTLQRLAKQGQENLRDCLKPVTPQDAPPKAAKDKIRLAVEGDAIEMALNAAAYFGSGPFSSDTPDQSSEQSSDPSSDQPQLEIELINSGDLPPDLAEAIESLVASSAELSAAETEAAETEAAETALEANRQDAEMLTLFDSSSAADPAAAGERSDLERSSPSPASDRPLQPKDILRWQTSLEDRITEVLQNLSHNTNRALQQVNILPSRLPEPVLEVAAKADLSSEAASSPNLLNLLVEANEGDEKPAMTQVIAIRLRLSEIEFSDANAVNQRSKLRQLMAQLSKIGRDYQRKQKECAIARAEAAWRSSWFEQEDD